MPTELCGWLIEATLATSAAVLAALLLHRRVRHAYGPRAGYAVWAIVPAALAATCVPAGTAVTPPEPLLVIQAPIRMLAAEVPRHAAADNAGWVCLAWASGALACALYFAWCQRSFVRGLGRLQVQGDGALRAQAIAGLPAVIGVLRPRVVMPEDAMSRYDADELALMLAHERAHIARGDLLVNAGVAALRCLFWFNPLLHLASRAFRDDQELACDQCVLARHPQSRRAYGAAMLKTQLAEGMLPLGCHWGQTHPLKERIEMLKLPMPNRRRQLLGAAIVLGLALTAGVATWAAQPAGIAAASQPAGNQHADFDARIQVMLDDAAPVAFTVSKGFGETFELSGKSPSRPQLTATVEPVLHEGALAYAIAMRIEQSGKVIASPQVMVRDGAPARVEQGLDRDGRFQGVRVQVAVTARDPQAARHAARPFVAPSSRGRSEAQPVAVEDASRRLAAPRYPAEALKQRKAGTVVLLVDVDAKGVVTAIKLDRSAGDARLDAAAMEAAVRWKFRPATKDGRQVATRVRVPIQFELDGPVKQDA